MFRSKLPSLHSHTNWRDIVLIHWSTEWSGQQATVMLCGQSSVITHQHRISQHREADVTITCRIMQGHDTCAAELGNNNSKLSSWHKMDKLYLSSPVPPPKVILQSWSILIPQLMIHIEDYFNLAVYLQQIMIFDLKGPECDETYV